MRKLPALAITLLLCLLFYSALSQYTLEIEITGIRNDKGVIMLQLFDHNQKVIAEEMGDIAKNRSTIKIKDLVSGQYAIRYYHDENLSGELETNVFGKPLEGYGFSNNVTGRFGPPAFDKWLFSVNKDTLIRLKPTY